MSNRFWKNGDADSMDRTTERWKKGRLSERLNLGEQETIENRQLREPNDSQNQQ